MPAANVPLVIDQGEDWTADIVWTDNFDEPVNIIHPCRMDVKNTGGATALSLLSEADPAEGTIPSIAISSDIGLLQLHMTSAETAALLPGFYQYDLVVTCDDGNVYSGTQITRLMYGRVTVNKRITVL